MFRKGNIAVLGGGLLGGSLGLDLNRASKVRLWCRRDATVDEGKRLGLDASACIKYVVHEADLVILCVPVGAMGKLLQEAIDAGMPKSSLVTDVGSVKRMPHQALSEICDQFKLSFIGSHPMAGGEKGGLQNARVGIFRNAACILTNDFHVEADQCNQLEAFWQELGCRTSWMAAEAHDALVARVSHFPHLLAALGIKVALPDFSIAQYAGGGLRDTTRVAGGNPAMWCEIVSENRDAILPALHDAMVQLEKMRDLIRDNQHDGLLQWLTEAKELRDRLI